MKSITNISLNGEWQLFGREECGAAPAPALAEASFSCTASVPGNIENELFRAGVVEDPYLYMNAQQLRPYEFYEWVYSREFICDRPAAMRLVCDGVDCIATYFVNGHEIGHSENAMIPAVFPVPAEYLQAGSNTIAVHLASANNAFRKYPLQGNALSAYPFNYESTRIRKPAHAWGWDITPRMPLGGIFRDIRLEEIPDWEIEECMLNTELMEEESVRLMFAYKFNSCEYTIKDLEMTVDGKCGDSTWHGSEAVWSVQGVFRITVKNPLLWWPRHYGKANVYECIARLRRRSTGEVLAEKHFTAGIRQIKLIADEVWTEKDSPDFQFVVNGKPVRVFGCNHVPADALHSNDPQRLVKIVEMAADLDCNMMRIWGGGIYESDEFYDLCDREGIMLWHDFMMGCANYPQDQDFCNVLRAEAEAAVRRLRQHPSIALWAGDNECDCCMSFWGIPLDPTQNVLTRAVLTDVCRRMDPFRSYLPSSPWYSPAAIRKANELDGNKDAMFFAPEQHLWGPRDYFKSDFYRTTKASFTSEIGYHGCPNVSSIKKFISPEKQWPWNDNEQWNFHASNPFLPDNDFQNYRTALMAEQIREMFGFIPDNLEEFACASQICQAEAKKYFIELIRSRTKMSGILWWNLIDCWPQFSDAVVDYYYSKKLAYHYIRRVQNKVLLMVPEVANWQRQVLAVNDSLEVQKGTYQVSDGDTGEIIAEGSFTLNPGEIKAVYKTRTCTTEQKLIILKWNLEDGTRGVNHAVTGHPQFSLPKYREWMTKIAALDNSFDPANVGA
ncbi:MAG: hypothetical protein J6S21_01975 [Victivallales bacterium]|nr:hypothetical protein [Victivallales bacterium]